MASEKRRIHSKGKYRALEAIAGGAGIYPGMQVKYNSSGEVVVHASAGGAFGDLVLIALEDALQGSKNVTTVYASGDRVFLALPAKGSEFNLRIADGVDLDVGDIVIPNGDGNFKEDTGTPEAAIGIAIEANDLTGSNTDATLSAVIIS